MAWGTGVLAVAGGLMARRGSPAHPWLLRAEPTGQMLLVSRTQIPPLLEGIVMVSIFFSKLEQNILKPPHTMKTTLRFGWNAETLPFSFWSLAFPLLLLQAYKI